MTYETAHSIQADLARLGRQARTMNPTPQNQLVALQVLIRLTEHMAEGLTETIARLDDADKAPLDLLARFVRCWDDDEAWPDQVRFFSLVEEARGMISREAK